MHVTVIVLVAFLSFLPARFRGQHCTIPAGDCRPLDIPRPDPNDNEDNLLSSTKEEDLICTRQRDTINLIAKKTFQRKGNQRDWEGSANESRADHDDG